MNTQEQLLTKIRDLYDKMSWLNGSKMLKKLKGYKSSEVHFIEAVGKSADCNVTRLAENFYMTRGAISKLSKKLIQKGVIESYQKPDNKKEIYFSLTLKGQAVFGTHEQLHREFRERDSAVFEEVTSRQLESLLGFVEKYSAHLDEEIKKLGEINP